MTTTPQYRAAQADLGDVLWQESAGLVAYPDALSAMETRAEAIRLGTAPERIWLLEHPPLYTAGTSARPDELLDARFPVYPAGRGGRYTYHGPGQRTCYVQLNLAERGRDVRCFVHKLEEWVIAALRDFGVTAWQTPDRVGIWTHNRAGQEAKIGAIGVRVKRWVTLHGFAVNVAPDLAHFGGIVPCGLPDFAVTSLADLGIDAAMRDLDAALLAHAPNFLRAVSTAALSDPFCSPKERA